MIRWLWFRLRLALHDWRETWVPTSLALVDDVLHRCGVGGSGVVRVDQRRYFKRWPDVRADRGVCLRCDREVWRVVGPADHPEWGELVPLGWRARQDVTR